MTQRGYNSQSRGSSSYEEALKRSNERIDQMQRSSRRASDMQQSLRYSDDDPRAERYTQQRERKTIRIDDTAFDTPQASAPRISSGGQDTWQGSSQYSRDAYSQNSYREQQMKNLGRSSGAYKARPATFSTTAPAPDVSPRGLVVRAAICAVLLIVCIVSFVRIGPANAGLSAARQELEQKQEELNAATSANTDLQSQIDNMQSTIAAYNDLVAKS